MEMDKNSLWFKLLFQAPGYAFAAFLIWWLTTTLDARLAQHSRDHENQLKVASDTAYVVMSMEKLFSSLDRMAENSRLTCVNTARTEAGRSACK